MRKIANTRELQRELQRLLAHSAGKRPSRVRIAAELEALSVRVSGEKRAEYDPSICMCGNPRHKGITPEPLSAADAKRIWAQRTKGQWLGGDDLHLTPQQCETIMNCWDALPGNYSYATTFAAIMKHGSDAILTGRIRGRRR